MPLPIASNGEPIIIGYVPNIPLAVVGIAVFGILTAVFFLNFFIYGRQRYLLWVTIGSLAMAAGFAVRIPYSNDPTSIPIYTVSTLLILLSPCAFIAQDYYVLPQMAEWVDASDCLFLKPRLIGRIFLTSDVITFLLQLAGSAMAAAVDLATIGDKIALTGLALQLVSFSIFIFLLMWFGYQTKRRHYTKWTCQQGLGWRRDWRAVYWACLWTCFGIMIRCVFRVIEFAQGYDGYLRTTEWCFYALDTLPIFLAIAVWAFIWPTKYLRPGSRPMESPTSMPMFPQGYSRK